MISRGRGRRDTHWRSFITWTPTNFTITISFCPLTRRGLLVIPRARPFNRRLIVDPRDLPPLRRGEVDKSRNPSSNISTGRKRANARALLEIELYRRVVWRNVINSRQTVFTWPQMSLSNGKWRTTRDALSHRVVSNPLFRRHETNAPRRSFSRVVCIVQLKVHFALTVSSAASQ